MNLTPDSQDSREANKALVRRFIDEFKNGCKVEAADDLCSSNFVMHGAEDRDRNQLKAFRLRIAKAHPNAHGQIQDLLADGDKVVERSIWTAQDGDDPNKRVKWWEIHIYRIENGKIAELWSQAETPRPVD